MSLTVSDNDNTEFLSSSLRIFKMIFILKNCIDLNAFYSQFIYFDFFIHFET